MARSKEISVVFCLEGRSWRKDFCESYKRNRKNVRDAHEQKKRSKRTKCFGKHLTIKDSSRSEKKTNCTSSQNPKLEADDLIAGWVQAHPMIISFIISTDGDFAPIDCSNVAQYNGVPRSYNYTPKDTLMIKVTE